jgi:hypothetical protein
MSTSSFGAEAIFGDLISDGIAGLQGAATQYGGSNINNPGGAIAALQSAGAAAVKVVGPAIDALSGGDPQVAQVTQGVWQKNGFLAGINAGDSATQSDLTSAVSIVQWMASQYAVGSRLAKSLKASPAAQVAARNAGAPKVVKAAAVKAAPTGATTSAVSPAAPAPTSVVPVPGPFDMKTVAPITGGVFGLVLGGAVGFKLSAQIGMLLGGPLGAVIGAGIGYQISKQINP